MGRGTRNSNFADLPNYRPTHLTSSRTTDLPTLPICRNPSHASRHPSRPLRYAPTLPRIDKFMVASPLVGDGSLKLPKL
ncbi:MAG: hypothetical protein ACK40X_13835 [Armatimonadota bacterium]